MREGLECSLIVAEIISHILMLSLTIHCEAVQETTYRDTQRKPMKEIPFNFHQIQVYTLIDKAVLVYSKTGCH